MTIEKFDKSTTLIIIRLFVQNNHETLNFGNGDVIITVPFLKMVLPGQRGFGTPSGGAVYLF